MKISDEFLPQKIFEKVVIYRGNNCLEMLKFLEFIRFPGRLRDGQTHQSRVSDDFLCEEKFSISQ